MVIFKNKLVSMLEGRELIRLSALIISMTALFISSMFSFFVLYPRTYTGRRGIVFFGAIVKWPSSTEYADKVLSSDSFELQRDTAIHNYELSIVASKKFKALKRCLGSMIIGVLFTLVYLALSWYFQGGILMETE